MYEQSILDFTALQGAWEQLDFEANGIARPPNDYPGSLGSITTFADNSFSVCAADGALLLAGTFKIDASSSPKSVDWTDSIGTDAGKTLRAIYKLDGDHFVFIAADPGAPRPSIFRTSPGLTMRTFVRRQKSA